MPAIVNSVETGSIADEIGIDAGDEILAIDDCKLRDLIDYNFYCKNEFLTLSIKHINGQLEDVEIEKDYDEPLGIIFESAVFDRIKPCCNHCIFCFVDQQPKGLRDTLYIKDDDYRLSYLQGTYITLTNLTEQDKLRISGMHLGPFYVSVHTTNPELRAKMLRNPNASKIMEHLMWFRKQKIPVHCQIVLCPGYNDGEELRRTLTDLKSLKRTVLSIAPDSRKDSSKKCASSNVMPIAANTTAKGSFEPSTCAWRAICAASCACGKPDAEKIGSFWPRTSVFSPSMADTPV